jgi:hypothetical protein
MSSPLLASHRDAKRGEDTLYGACITPINRGVDLTCVPRRNIFKQILKVRSSRVESRNFLSSCLCDKIHE